MCSKPNGVVRGAQGARSDALGACAPPGRIFFFGGGAYLQGNVVSAPPGKECTPPEAEQEFIF